MPKEKCSSDAHVWACQTTQGNLGEITINRQLTSTQVALITQDQSRIAEVCPGGIIKCVTCDEPFIGATRLQKSVDLDQFDNMRARLLR